MFNRQHGANGDWKHWKRLGEMVPFLAGRQWALLIIVLAKGSGSWPRMSHRNPTVNYNYNYSLHAPTTTTGSPIAPFVHSHLPICRDIFAYLSCLCSPRPAQ